jgi:competence protein ComEC
VKKLLTVLLMVAIFIASSLSSAQAAKKVFRKIDTDGDGVPDTYYVYEGEEAAPPIPEEAPLKGGILKVTFIDIGEGDSCLIQTPGGKNILIDGGKGYRGKEVLSFLKRKGIRRIDTMVATHPDMDHIGGLLAVLDSNIRIGEILDCGKAHTSATYRNFLNKIEQRKSTKYSQPRAGQTLNWGEEVKVRVLSPPHLRWDSNDCSIVIKLTYGRVSFLFTGDAAEEAEKEMVSRYSTRLKSTILKAGHHGSRSSSSYDFLRSVRPEIAIISVGKNPYGHPTKEVLDRLTRLGIKVYRTDLKGNITITTNGEDYQVRAR